MCRHLVGAEDVGVGVQGAVIHVWERVLAAARFLCTLTLQTSS